MMTTLELKRILRVITDFEEWVSCDCSECRYDGRSHAIDENKSMNNLLEQMKAEFENE
jgi:hypothetical protein